MYSSYSCNICNLNTGIYFLPALNKKDSLFKINKEWLKGFWMFKAKEKSDLILLITVCLLSVFGSIMVFSAGYAYAKARYDDSNYFIKRQLIWLVIGLVLMYLTSHIKPTFYEALTPVLYIVTILLLILVLVIGFVGNGAKRWISIGPLTIQPSEIAKIAIILIMAKYFSAYEKKALDFKDKKTILIYATVFPILLMLIPIVLVMLQKHLSCIIILGILGLLMIVASGVNLRYIALCCVIGVSGVSALAIFTDYTKERIMVWQNPELYKLTGGWQTLQGLMAIGSGGIFGVGLGKSVMKHCYVSEPANDMIFAILCEELGFTGALLAISLFALLIFRGLKISLSAPNVFTRLSAFGISIKMGVQVLLNIAVVTNTIPNTGISLPFFSYGGSSLIMIFIEMGILLSISRYSKIQK